MSKVGDACTRVHCQSRLHRSNTSKVTASRTHRLRFARLQRLSPRLDLGDKCDGYRQWAPKPSSAHVASGGSTEDSSLTPAGEYANYVGCERVIAYYSTKHGSLPAVRPAPLPATRARVMGFVTFDSAIVGGRGIFPSIGPCARTPRAFSISVSMPSERLRCSRSVDFSFLRLGRDKPSACTPACGRLRRTPLALARSGFESCTTDAREIIEEFARSTVSCRQGAGVE